MLGFLQNSLDPSILEAYSHCETAKSLWDTLKKIYGDVSNLSRVYEVKKAISELKQDDHDFTKYLGKFSSAWSELEMLRPSTLNPKVLIERKEQDKIDPKNAGKVCKLHKSIYGLKQASRSWNLRFDEAVKQFGFIKNEEESCVYKKTSGSKIAFLVLYVDDILLLGNDVPLLQSVKTWL
ncbi:reverse transcriptase domain-containing protein, partial [Cutibacterium acnes]